MPAESAGPPVMGGNRRQQHPPRGALGAIMRVYCARVPRFMRGRSSYAAADFPPEIFRRVWMMFPRRSLCDQVWEAEGGGLLCRPVFSHGGIFLALDRARGTA